MTKELDNQIDLEEYLESVKPKRIVYNALQTPDGTVIESTHRHDYVTHTDENGKVYMVDGGHEYVRSSAHGDEEYLTVYNTDPHDQKRTVMKWGTYGPEGTDLLKYVPIKDMSDDHIKNILKDAEDGMWVNPNYIEAFKDELTFRIRGEDMVEDAQDK